MPTPKVRSRLNQLAEKQARLKEQLESLDGRIEAGAEVISDALEFLDRSEELYRESSDSQRYLLNRALFRKLYIRDGEVAVAEFNDPFGDVVSAYEALAGTDKFPNLQPVVLPTCENRTERLATALSSVGGSSNAVMVGAEGLEPPTCWL